jgi:hypothetical protein
MATPTAILRRVGRVYSYIVPASFFRFAGQFAEELRPRCIMNALSKTAIMGHAVDMQVFYRDDPVGIDDLSTFLVGEIVSFEPDTFMDMGDSLPMLPSFRCAFCQFGMLPLNACKLFFFFSEEAWVVNFVSIRQGSERFESYVNPHLGRKFRQSLRFAFYRKRSVALASRTSLNGERFDVPS